jgi:inner membrane protein
VIFLGVACSVLPDLDVVSFRFGVPYGHLLGHRGLSHSIAFAVFLSTCLAWLLPLQVQPTQASRLMIFGFLLLSTLSHGILDAMTSGGLGVAFFAPIDNTRYFFAWRPIRVSPISVSGFFSERGVQVLQSELRWVWLPAASLALLLIFLRRLG